jgi:hypothetical protein
MRKVLIQLCNTLMQNTEFPFKQYGISANRIFNELIDQVDLSQEDGSRGGPLDVHFDSFDKRMPGLSSPKVMMDAMDSLNTVNSESKFVLPAIRPTDSKKTI